MEPVKLLTSGLTLEESKAKRQEKQAARYRHRLGKYVPSGDSRGLLEALMATSPRKSPALRRHMTLGSTKRGKPIKLTKGNSNDEIVDGSTQETEKRTKLRKSTSRKPIKVTDASEKEVDRGERSDKDTFGCSRSRAKVDAATDEVEKQPKPSTSRQTEETTSIANSRSTKLSKKSRTATTSKPSIPERSKAKSKKSSAKPLPIQTDEESDDLAIKTTKDLQKVDKGKARPIYPFPETFEPPGTDNDLEDSRARPSNPKLLFAEKGVLGDAFTAVRRTTTIPLTSRVASNGRDVSDEESQQKPPPQKRGHPRSDEKEEEPLPKRGRMRKSNGKHSARTEPKRQSKKSSSKARPTGAKGRTRKKVDPPPETSELEREILVSPQTKAPKSNARRHQQRTLDHVSDDEKQSESGHEEASINPSRVRLDSIPPEGIVIRKKNGIVERLLPPATKPKRKALKNRGKIRGSLRQTIPAHVLKYIGPTRFGSPLKAEGTETDDDLNL